MTVIGDRPAQSSIVALSTDEAAAVPWQRVPGMHGIEIKVLSASEHGRCGLMRFEPGAHELAHSHVRGAHHVWVIDGSLRLGSRRLPAGSYVLTTPGGWHALEADIDGCTIFFAYVGD
jgi:quercetin dioxygenase-like cupin family protein